MGIHGGLLEPLFLFLSSFVSQYNGVARILPLRESQVLGYLPHTFTCKLSSLPKLKLALYIHAKGLWHSSCDAIGTRQGQS